MFQTKFVKKIKTRILSSINFFSENHAVYQIIVGKFYTARQAIDDNMIRHAFCLLDK